MLCLVWLAMLLQSFFLLLQTCPHMRAWHLLRQRTPVGYSQVLCAYLGHVDAQPCDETHLPVLGAQQQLATL